MLQAARPLSPRDRRRVDELAAAIARYDDRPVLPSVVRELAPLLDGEGSIACRFTPLASGWDFEFMHTAGLRRAAVDRLEGFFRRAPRRWAWFDPLLPEPRQRNRPIAFSSLTTWEEFDQSAIAQQVFTPSGMGRHEQFRILVCDGPLLLAWVGVFTRNTVAAREHAMMRRLIAPLRRRLTLERQLGLRSVYALATHAALDALPRAVSVRRERPRGLAVPLARAASSGAWPS